jgi:hypothetical protein
MRLSYIGGDKSMMRGCKVNYIELLVGQEKRNVIIDNVNGHRKPPRPRADRFG